MKSTNSESEASVQKNFEDLLSRVENNDPTLTEIDLSGKEIGSAKAVDLANALSGNDVVTNLNLTKCRIGNVGAKALAKALKNKKNITEVHFPGNQITSDGLSDLTETFQGNPNLTEVNFSHNLISDDGVRIFAKFLESNLTVSRANLSFNKIENEGAQALLKVFEKNRTLVHLNVNGNAFSKDLLDNIKISLKENRDFFQEVKPSPKLLAEDDDLGPDTKVLSNDFDEIFNELERDFKLQGQQAKIAYQQELAETRRNSIRPKSVFEKKIDPKFLEANRELQEMELIENNPALQKAAEIIEGHFNQHFLVAGSIAGGKISLEPGKASRVAGVFSSLVSSVPMASLASTAVGTVTTMAGQYLRKTHYENLSDLNPSFDARKSSLFSEKVARKIVLSDQEKIQRFSDAELVRYSEKLGDRALQYILSGNLRADLEKADLKKETTNVLDLSEKRLRKIVEKTTGNLMFNIEQVTTKTSSAESEILELIQNMNQKMHAQEECIEALKQEIQTLKVSVPNHEVHPTNVQKLRQNYQTK